MAKTSNHHQQSNSKTPVTLVTGLLGSGKTTAVCNLLAHKPDNENWAVIVNEFGDIGLDGAFLQQYTSIMQEVTGGCICCTAQFGLNNALQAILKDKPDHILIEPTGLGHPASIIDTVKQNPQLTLFHTYCLLNPQQLTPERWQKSAVMRDLITLADTVILNKSDLNSTETIRQAETLLKSLYPPKNQILVTQNAEFYPLPPAEKGLLLGFISGKQAHLETTHCDLSHYDSQLPKVISCQIQQGQIFTIGWIFEDKVQFNRIKLKNTLPELNNLIRAKGILKTGKEWQNIQYADHNLTFSDQAWRQDSRLELLFDGTIDFNEIEEKVRFCIEKTK